MLKTISREVKFKLSKGKDRDFDEGEFLLYMMGSFEFGESIEKLADEHNRTPAFIKDKIKHYLKIPVGLLWADHYFNKGIERSKKIQH